MAKAFSVVSWNVEHFKGRANRRQEIVDHLATQNADVIALYEVEGKEVFGALSAAMPNYNFHITEGRQTQEILVGVRQKPGLRAFFSQRVTFKSGNPNLRPGALLTLTVDSVNYSMMFLHLKSMPSPLGLGLRDDQLERAFKLKKKLDKAAPGNQPANFIFLGDLNTMGMKYRFRKSISAQTELQNLDKDAARKSIKMRRLSKTQTATWWNGPQGSLKPSNLDHVVASDHLEFRSFARPHPKGWLETRIDDRPSEGPDSTDRAEIDVRGWPQSATAAQAGTWIRQRSDHALLYFEVQKV